MVGRSRVGFSLRRSIAVGEAQWTSLLPNRIRAALDIDGDVVRPLRVEIGSGLHPSAGYVHVDADPASPHLEYVATASALPFQDDSVNEILAIHVLEHVHPTLIHQTLVEWHRVLLPGGVAQIHVPNAATVLPAFLHAPVEKKWKVMMAIFGVTESPETSTPERVLREYHKVIFDVDLLRSALEQAGFSQVEDVSATVTDRHNGPWEDDGLVARLSLVVRASAGAGDD